MVSKGAGDGLQIAGRIYLKITGTLNLKLQNIHKDAG